jgi:hypothetical protein
MSYPAGNTIELVTEVMADLKSRGVDPLLGGGWAEELQGLITARPHKDIDLYVIAPDLSTVEAYIASTGVKEIVEKRFPHKRAFLVDAVMVEAILIKQRNGDHWSDFWNVYRFDWPRDLRTIQKGIECLSIEALRSFRDDHTNRERHRQRTP